MCKNLGTTGLGQNLLVLIKKACNSYFLERILVSYFPEQRCNESQPVIQSELRNLGARAVNAIGNEACNYVIIVSMATASRRNDQIVIFSLFG